MTLDQIEKQAILSVLEANSWNRTHSAKVLDISIRTLRNKIKRYRSEGNLILDTIPPVRAKITELKPIICSFTIQEQVQEQNS